VIVDVTVETLRDLLKNRSLELNGIRSGKFFAPIRPGQEIRIVLAERDGFQWSVEWHFGEGGSRPAVSLILRLS
jgi:hypothetical protein